ncbi:uncharacterized protein MYCFIDRAFT_181609 [Pseudocercospora fijiensis CIRAD86]|uniref:Uncharacterized protein n=1 Tax=Pseudocercospora fijiensis (strain CIRAD86) TaxID=383855 RepID=N1Q9T5_PSEFD|nr:uncharacterized protein MYCFIDRAFT_181609 [Pseudocercospora fijiensis CIRAD86]EME89670.1 hypothetical protein MYCFIDRAFT_181609 [Pseudocercospora fijiensis CIRAD86]
MCSNLREWANRCCSEDESSIGDNEIARRASWDEEEQRETHMTQDDGKSKEQDSKKGQHVTIMKIPRERRPTKTSRSQ